MISIIIWSALRISRNNIISFVRNLLVVITRCRLRSWKMRANKWLQMIIMCLWRIYYVLILLFVVLDCRRRPNRRRFFLSVYAFLRRPPSSSSIAKWKLFARAGSWISPVSHKLSRAFAITNCSLFIYLDSSAAQMPALASHINGSFPSDDAFYPFRSWLLLRWGHAERTKPSTAPNFIYSTNQIDPTPNWKLCKDNCAQATIDSHWTNLCQTNAQTDRRKFEKYPFIVFNERFTWRAFILLESTSFTKTIAMSQSPVLDSPIFPSHLLAYINSVCKCDGPVIVVEIKFFHVLSFSLGAGTGYISLALKQLCIFCIKNNTRSNLAAYENGRK